MRTFSEMPENSIKVEALPTKTDGYVCPRNTDKLDETQKTREYGKNSCGLTSLKKPAPDLCSFI